MAFFDDISKKLSQTGQGMVQKTKEMADVAKLNSAITDEEGKINNNYYLIGKLYVSMHMSDCEDDFKGMISDIQVSESKIAEYRQQIKTIKGVVKCEKCGAEVANNIAFCSACGNPMPHKEIVNTDDKIKCESCGSFVNKGMRFCTACGKPMQIAMTVESTVETPSADQPKTCPNCGVQIEKDAIFCAECGTKIQ